MSDDYERLVGEVAMKATAGEKLLPWPELPQDLAFLAFLIDRLSARVAELETALRHFQVDRMDGDTPLFVMTDDYMAIWESVRAADDRDEP